MRQGTCGAYDCSGSCRTVLLQPGAPKLVGVVLRGWLRATAVSLHRRLSLSLSLLHAASLSRSLCALFSAVATSDLLGAYNLELASSAEVAEAADSAAQPQTSHLMSAAEVHAVVKFNLRADECEHVRS